MKIQIILFFLTTLTLTSKKKTEKLKNILTQLQSLSSPQKTKQNRNLMLSFGGHGVSPPLVSAPPPIFDSGQLPIQSVFNLIQYPHQYSSPLNDYAYPTIFNPYYNHMLPYGMPFQHLNPHALSSMGMYGSTPYNMSMMGNGFAGMLPYMNPSQMGMSGINNSAQNWGNESRKLRQVDNNIVKKTNDFDSNKVI